ncbi:MAG: histidine kinase [Pseudomonadota bacterium]
MNRRTVIFVAAMWISVGLIHALSRYVDIVKYDLPVPFTLADVGYYLLSYAAWIIVTLVLLRVMESARFTFTFWRLSAFFLGGLLLWLPMYFAYDYGVSVFVSGGGWAEWIDTLAATSGSVVFFYAVVYGLTFALCGGVVLAARARVAQRENHALEQHRTEAALELAEQHMQLMQSQLAPHFLFNCLSSMSYLARQSEKATLVDAISTLGSLLRFTVENASQGQIAVIDELHFVRDYIALQELRFGDRFVCVIDCDADAEQAMCLPFSLQPLLENVFRHVVERIPQTDNGVSEGVGIHVTIERRAAQVFMSVCNSQAPLDAQATPSPGHGTGINNLEARLAHTYGGDYALETRVSPEAYCVSLAFPDGQETHVV